MIISCVGIGVDAGSRIAIGDAYLLGQLECRDVILKKRRHAFDRYEEILSPHAEELGFTTPVIPDHCEAAYHMFYVLLPDRATRDKALADMKDDGIRATFHYVPLHSSQGGRRFAAEPVDCPVTDDISGRLLRLPFHNGLSEETLQRVTDSFLRSVRS